MYIVYVFVKHNRAHAHTSFSALRGMYTYMYVCLLTHERKKENDMY